MRKAKLISVLMILASIWIGVVTFFYFFVIKFQFNNFRFGSIKSYSSIFQSISTRYNHSYYFNNYKNIIEIVTKDGQRELFLNPVLSLVLLLLGLFALFWLYTKYISKKKVDIFVTPIILIFIVLGFLLILYQFWIAYFNVTLPVLHANVYTKVFTNFGEVFLILLPVIALGYKIFKLLFKKSEMFSLSLVFSIGFGISSYIIILFILGLFHLLNSTILIILVIVTILLCLKELIYIINKLIFYKIKIYSKKTGPTLLLFFVALIAFAQNSLESLKTSPSAHDDLEQYMNTTKLIVENHGLSHFSSYPFSWELFRTLPMIIFNNTTATLLLSSFSGIFVFLAVFALVKIYCQKRNLIFHKQENFYPLLMAVIFYLLPGTSFLTVTDMKVDLMAFFFGALAFISFIFFLEKKEKNINYLFISAFFCGVAFTVKITSIYFAVALLVLALALLIKEKYSFKLSFKIILLSIFCFLLPFLPFGIKNIIENNSHKNQNSQIQPLSLSQKILLNYSETPQFVTVIDPIKSKQIDDVIVSNGQMEISRYLGFSNSKIINYLQLPFTATFNTRVGGQHVDYGFLFLAIIPLVLLFSFLIKKKNNKNILFFYSLIIGALVSWGFWLITASGIIWYGILGFIFYILLIVELIDFVKSYGNQILKITLSVAVSIWLISSFVHRTSYIPVEFLYYIRGSLSESEEISMRIPGYYALIDINNKIVKANDPTKNRVYLIGRYRKYYISNNDTLVLEDQSEGFAKIYQEKDDIKTIERMKESGFKYLIFTNDRTVNYNHAEIIEWEDQFINFIFNNPDKIKVYTDYNSTGVIIAEIL